MTTMNTLRVTIAAFCLLALGACSNPPRLESPRGGTPAAPGSNLREAAELARQAELAEANGQPRKAIGLYRQAVRLSPNLPAAWNNLGVLLIQEQEYMDAVSALQVAADLDQSDPRPVENLGTAYHKSGHDQDALRYYLEALKRDPNWLPALRGLARTSARLNATDEKLLAHMNRALMLEKNPRWREMFERERIRLEYAYSQKDI